MAQLPGDWHGPGFVDRRQLEIVGPVCEPVVLQACAIATSGSVA
jgi:hypothetical protein